MAVGRKQGDGAIPLCMSSLVYTYLLRKQCHLEPPQVREEVTVQEYLEAGGRRIQVNIFMTTNCSTIPGGLTSVTGVIHAVVYLGHRVLNYEI